MSLRRPLLTFVLLVVAAAASAAPLDLPNPKEKWLVLNADEFRFISSVSPAATLDIARDMLRMRAAIGKITQLKVRGAHPTRVFIFPSERRFRGYRDTLLERKSDATTGVFISTSSGNFILLQGDATHGVDRVVYHELTHYFVRNTAAELPLWLSEGLAEFYATFRTTRDAVQIGRPIAEHVHWLRDHSLIPIRDLFTVTKNSPEYNESNRQGAFYSQSWALVHYVMTDEGRRAKLGEFLRQLSAGKKLDDAFAGAFAMPFAELERDLRTYVNGKAFKFTSYAIGEIAVPEPPQPTPMSYDAVLFELGHLIGRTTPSAAATAERFLTASVEHNPKNAAAYATLGRVHDLTGRRADANAAYAKAVQLETDDAEVYLLAGASMFERFAKRSTADVPKEDIAKAQALFKRAKELDPNSALAWAGFGATYVALDDDPAPGIAALEKSLALSPGNDEATFYLMQLYGRTSRFAEARKLGTELLARTAAPQMQEFIRRALERMDSIESANAAVGRINEAISKANAGKYDEALALLDAALPTITEPSMLEHAKQFRAQLAEQAAKKKKK